MSLNQDLQKDCKVRNCLPEGEIEQKKELLGKVKAIFPQWFN